MTVVETTDKVVIQNWYLGTQYHVEQFKTSDGKTLLDSKVQDLVAAMAGFSAPPPGQTTLDSARPTMPTRLGSESDSSAQGCLEF